MSVLCYFPWNLRLQSSVRLRIPFLPEDMICSVSWLKSGNSERLDNLDLRTYTFPLWKGHPVPRTKSVLCSCSFVSLESEISHRICRYIGDVWLIERIKLSWLHGLLINVCYIPTFRLALLEFRPVNFISYLYTPWVGPGAQSALKSVNQADWSQLRE